ncbi:MAG: hypothetical protein ACLT0Y_04885 [Christensenellales bacterium]
MEIVKAKKTDIDEIEKIYENIHDEEEAGRATIGWIRGVYPTRKTAEDALDRGDLFVLKDEGQTVAAAIINRIQVEEYKYAVEARGEGAGDYGAAQPGGGPAGEKQGLWQTVCGVLSNLCQTAQL